jgi:hypothetical protein
VTGDRLRLAEDGVRVAVRPALQDVDTLGPGERLQARWVLLAMATAETIADRPTMNSPPSGFTSNRHLLDETTSSPWAMTSPWRTTTQT